MKNLIIALLFFGLFNGAYGQQFKIITVVESIVPMGIGRSRIIEHQDLTNAEELTTERTTGNKSNQGDVSRKAAKIDNLLETKLLNFYSGVGINFQNIASNDALISSKINSMIEKGWTLSFVTSGVESMGGQTDANGIFITRLFFRKD